MPLIIHENRYRGVFVCMWRLELNVNLLWPYMKKMLDKKEYISVNITSEGTVSTKQYLQHMPARSIPAKSF